MAFQNPTMLPWLTIEQNIMLPLKIVQPFRPSIEGEAQRRISRQGACIAGPGRPQGFAAKISLAAVRRHAAAGQSLPGADPRAAHAAARRAVRRARPVHQGRTLVDPAELWLQHKPTVLLVTHDLREAGFLASRICVMSARPGRILDDSAVAFARPRTIAMTFEPDFVALNQRLRDLIVNARSALRRGGA
jgi:NitT/TauT family transport system ATP-binding protein